MNPLDWIKAATLVTQHKQEAAITKTDQLSSMPLSQLAMDDSGPPVVHYGMHMPTVTSTPTGKEVQAHGSQQEDSYQQIIPGIPQGSLYPTFHHSAQKQYLLKKRHYHIAIKCPKVWRNIYKMLNNAVL